MSDLSIRRSVESDATQLTRIISIKDELLKSRYGRTDLKNILEESIFSLTVLADDEAVAIACFNFPPDSHFYAYRKLMLSFFVAEAQYETQVPDLILRTVFESQPCIETVVTQLTATAPIEGCLRPKFIEDGDIATATREAFLPPLVIRAARVEDYDDLMPLFRRDAPDLIEEYGEFFVSDLIRGGETKCLVAEGPDGLAVGFIGLEPSFDITDHASDYELAAFEDLLTQPGAAFRIRLFFIADAYRMHARDFMKPMFSLMRNSDYAVMFLPTYCPPSPLAPFFTQIPSIFHGLERYVLHLCHRDSLGDVVLAVRPYSQEDASLLENFIEPLMDRTEFLEAVTEKPTMVYELLANEIITGVAIFSEDEHIDSKAWDLQEFVDVAANNKHAQILKSTISPLFQKYTSFFLFRCMEQLKVNSLFIKGKPPASLTSLFLAIERRQGPNPKTIELHPEQKESVHILPRKYVLQPKLEVTASIVIVGSTEGVSSFLYKLVSVPYLHFSSLHVVCDGGEERVWTNTAGCREYHPDWLQHLYVLNAATFHSSDLNDINREGQTIILDDGSEVAYDYLVILTAKEGEVGDLWTAKKFKEENAGPVTIVGDSLVAYYLLSHYPGCAHIAHNPRFKLEGTLATAIRDSKIAECDFKEVPPKLLGILERSSLVYDGGIVIDELFRTNDSRIFAVGPLTMFSRLYRARDTGEVISQTEYGKSVASVILRFVDPINREEEPPLIVGSDDAKTLIATKGPHSLPKFSTRRAEMYLLPGNRIFYRNGYPSSKCRCLETVKGNRTTRIFVDDLGFIKAFEYLGESNGAVYDWNKFIGLPANLLNNMVERFDQNMISDFGEYFAQPWAAATIHDCFRKFFDKLLDVISTREDIDSPEVEHMIREELLTFLVDNRDLLPDYFTSEDQLEPLDEDDE